MSCFIYQIMAPEKVYQLQLTLAENETEDRITLNYSLRWDVYNPIIYCVGNELCLQCDHIWKASLAEFPMTGTKWLIYDQRLSRMQAIKRNNSIIFVYYLFIYYRFTPPHYKQIS